MCSLSRPNQPVIAKPADLPALEALESLVFTPERQESRRGLARSLKSPFQEVWVVRGPQRIVASTTLRLHPKSLRVYSLAVHPDCRGQGLGELLMEKTLKRARTLKKSFIRLEADAGNPRLISWYQRLGYHFVCEIPAYYGPGTSAHRLQKIL